MVPPGPVTRAISRRAARASGTKFRTSPETATSTAPSSSGICSALPRLSNTRPANWSLGLREKAFRRLDARHRHWRTAVQDRRAERSGAASDIQPAPRGGTFNHERNRGRDLPAPAAYVLLVGIASFPGIRYGRGRHRAYFRYFAFGRPYFAVNVALPIGVGVDHEAGQRRRRIGRDIQLVGLERVHREDVAVRLVALAAGRRRPSRRRRSRCAHASRPWAGWRRRRRRRRACSSVTLAGMLTTDQCHQPEPVGASGSYTVTAKLLVSLGAPLHFKAGDLFSPEQPKPLNSNFLSIRALALMSGLAEGEAGACQCRSLLRARERR